MADPEYTIDKVFNALTDDWMSSRALHRITDQGSERTVGAVLRKLADEGRAEQKMMPYQGGTIAMFRKVQSNG